MAREERAVARDERIVAGLPIEADTTMVALLTWTRNQFRAVAARGCDAFSLIKMTPRQRSGARELLCGDRQEGTFYQRHDGLRCQFKINVQVQSGALHLLSYAMQVEAPEGHAAPPPFLRWEYSPTRKKGVSAVREPLAHLHPGHDDIRVPSPVLSPKELLAVFLSLELWT